MRKALLELGALRDLVQDLVALVEQSKAEGSESTLDKGTVIVNLVGDLLLDNDLGDTRAHHQVLGLEVAIMQRMVEGLQEDGLDLQASRALLQHGADQLIDDLHTGLVKEVDGRRVLALESLASLLVDAVVLVVEVLQFHQ